MTNSRLSHLLVLAMMAFVIPMKATYTQAQECIDSDQHNANSDNGNSCVDKVESLFVPDDHGPMKPNISNVIDDGNYVFWLGPPPSQETEQIPETDVVKDVKLKPRRNLKDQILEKQLFSQLMPPPARWDAACMLASMSIVPIFSDTGYKVIKIPDEIYKEMRMSLDRAMESKLLKSDKYLVNYGSNKLNTFANDNEDNNVWLESNGIIYRHPYVPLYVPQSMDEATRVLQAIQPLAEEFAGGTPLQIRAQHGFRFYTRYNQMFFHTDRVFSHGIGCNIHIRHHYDDDSNPWPFEIYNHRTNTIDRITLEEGYMIIYEAVGNMHSRPEPLRGDYYASTFYHFVPVSGWPYNVRDVVSYASHIFDWKNYQVDSTTNNNGEKGNGMQWYSAGKGHFFRQSN